MHKGCGEQKTAANTLAERMFRLMTYTWYYCIVRKCLFFDLCFFRAGGGVANCSIYIISTMVGKKCGSEIMQENNLHGSKKKKKAKTHVQVCIYYIRLSLYIACMPYTWYFLLISLLLRKHHRPCILPFLWPNVLKRKRAHMVSMKIGEWRDRWTQRAMKTHGVYFWTMIGAPSYTSEKGLWPRTCDPGYLYFDSIFSRYWLYQGFPTQDFFLSCQENGLEFQRWTICTPVLCNHAFYYLDAYSTPEISQIRRVKDFWL